MADFPQGTLHAISTGGDKATASGLGVWLFGSLTSTDIAAYGGLVIAFLGLVIAGIFKWLEWKELRRHNRAVESKRWGDR